MTPYSYSATRLVIILTQLNSSVFSEDFDISGHLIGQAVAKLELTKFSQDFVPFVDTISTYLLSKVIKMHVIC